MIQLTSAMLVMTEDAIGQGCHPLSGAYQCKAPLHQVGEHSTLLRQSSSKLPGQTSSSPSLGPAPPRPGRCAAFIPGQSSTFIECTDLEVSCGSGDNKRRETLTFKVASFDIGDNCILGKPFLLKFMAVIHPAYATMKIP
jgi:hypothetical protein